MEQGTLCVRKDNRGACVKKSNEFARARWEGKQSVLEMRLVAILASKIVQDADSFLVYRIPMSELLGRKICGGRDGRELEAAAKKLMSRVVHIRFADGSWKMRHVMDQCDFDAKTQTLTMVFHKDMRDHLLNLKACFTRYTLDDFIKLPSVYSQRLFEFLKSWEGQEEVVWPLAELHEMMQTPETYKRDYAQFRRFVLEKGQKDLKAIDFQFSWEPIKSGHTVDRIRFRIIGSPEARRRREERRLKLRSEALLCLNSHGRACNEERNRPEVCEICNLIRPKKVDEAKLEAEEKP